MRLPDSSHTARPWRIHELTPDFKLEDAWALPTPGDKEDFASLVDQFAASDPARKLPAADRAYRGVMTVLVKPNGLLGSAYMAAIRPFRHLVVYPALMRQIERAWQRRSRGSRTGVAV